jgi:pimeloyl-ACP methyl ester carboxylesterase
VKKWTGSAAVALLMIGAVQAKLPDRYYRPVKEASTKQIVFNANGNTVSMPIYTSLDWTVPHPELDRAVLIFHGLLRNADVYFAGGLKAQQAAGDVGAKSIVISPQFLTDYDIKAHDLPPTTLAFGPDEWAGGEPAIAPAPVSGFSAIDAILAHLADRALFPNLKTVVIAGFSGGGQIVQRYAVAGNGEAVLTKAGIATQYVVADPSSYLYFTADRPDPKPNCKDQNSWKYGFDSGVPPYLTQSVAELEARYAARRVTYMIGADDTDPNHPVLDKSCGGEAQGLQRNIRAHNYFAMMKARHPTGLNQRFVEVPGIAHEGTKMFSSVCGVDALFGKPGCAALDAAE